MKRVLLCFVGLVLCVHLNPNFVFAQQTITGTITDELGNPLVGVTVTVKQTDQRFASNENGEYEVKADVQNPVLVFTFVGFTKHESLPITSNSYDVSLSSEGSSLDEVVVLGFGQTQRKIAQTGSIASVNHKQLKQSPTANVLNALAGRLPGLTTIQRSGLPGDDAPSMYIRGRATTGNSNPLVTIDGVQRDMRALILLDVNEIENITILKDASATALYGVKGANGVIIVTTRRGRSGKPSATFSYERGIQDAVKFPEILGSYQHALLANEAYLNDNPNGIGPYSEEALEAYRTGSDPLKYPDVDWMEETFQPGTQTRANFNINGGSEKARYFVNIGYLDQGGLYNAEKNSEFNPNAFLKRYNFRSNIDIDFNKDFSIGLSLNGAIENKNEPLNSVGELLDVVLRVPPNGSPVKYPTGFYGYNGVVLNPVWLMNTRGYRESFNSGLSGLLNFERKLDFITEGLSLKGNYSFDGYYNNGLTRAQMLPLARYSGTGDFDDMDSYAYQYTFSPLSSPMSVFTQNRDIWMDASLNYQNSIGDHDFSGLLLVNRTQKVIGNTVPYVSQGLVTRIVYNYKQRYFAEFNAGYNGTDNFARGNRYGFFPAASLGWVVSDEPFMKDQNVVSFLKLRGSFGITGNDQLTGRRWLFFSEYSSSAAGYSIGESLQARTGIAEGPMANPDVSWEKARKGNLGVELKLFSDLFSVNVDLFRENRYDILITRSTVPSILGVTSSNLPPVNMGKILNQGYEVELGHKHRINKINYFLNANVSYAKNKILFIDEEEREYPWLRRTGGSINQVFALAFDGFYQNQDEIDNGPTQFGKLIPGDIRYKDLNGDGVIDGEDQGAIGRTMLPEFFFGLSGGFNIGKFDFSFLFQGAANSSRMLAAQGVYEFYNSGTTNTLHLGRWTPETAATATYPVLHYTNNSNNHRQSSFFLDDNSYLRLKNVEMGYSFAFNRVISSLRVFTSGTNLFTWTEARVFDPENTSNGVIFPPMRVFNLGLMMNF